MVLQSLPTLNGSQVADRAIAIAGAPGAVGQSPFPVQQIDPHGDSAHMGTREPDEACRFGQAWTRPSISGSVIHTNGFVRELL
jgi:hypothetical protein